MSDTFDALTDAIDPALLVVTTTAEGVRAGCVVGFHSQSGLDPQRYCVWLSKANYTYRTALRATHFAVHFLTDQDLVVAERFGTRSSEDVDKFAGIEVTTGPHDLPLLDACPHRIVVERLAVLDDGSDHVCVSTRVLAAESTGPFTPLRLSAAAELAPGREAEERSVEP